MAATRKAKNGQDVVTLHASGAETATGQSSAIRLPGYVSGIAFVCDLSAAATEANDTFNLTVQTKLDGANWLDVVHFTEMLGNGSAKRYIAKIASDTVQAEFENGATLGAAAVRHLFGDDWRASWVIVDPTGTNASFTFALTAMPM